MSGVLNSLAGGLNTILFEMNECNNRYHSPRCHQLTEAMFENQLVLRSPSRLQVHLALLRKTATAVRIVVQASSDHIQHLSRIERDHRAFRITSAIAQQQQVSINQPVMGYLSTRALNGLKAYEYKPGGYTWLDNIHRPWLDCKHDSGSGGRGAAAAHIQGALTQPLMLCRVCIIPATLAGAQPDHSGWHHGTHCVLPGVSLLCTRL